MKKIISIALLSMFLIACSSSNTSTTNENDLKEIKVTQDSQVIENLGIQSVQMYGLDSKIVFPDSQKLDKTNSTENQESSEYFFESNDSFPAISSVQVENLCASNDTCDVKSLQELKDSDSNLANYEILTIGDLEYLTSGCLGLGDTCTSVIYKTKKDNNLVTIFIDIEDESQISSAQDLVSEIQFN